MNFQDAVRKSIKNFLDGKMPKNLTEMNEGEIVFTPEYFDGFAESLQDAPAPEEEEEDDEI